MPNRSNRRKKRHGKKSKTVNRSSTANEQSLLPENSNTAIINSSIDVESPENSNPAIINSSVEDIASRLSDCCNIGSANPSKDGATSSPVKVLVNCKSFSENLNKAGVLCGECGVGGKLSFEADPRCGFEKNVRLMCNACGFFKSVQAEA